MTADPRDTARRWLADTMCADLDVDLDKHRVPMYRVVTIRLPVQPIGEGT